MIFKSITITNFRQFRGVNRIEFSTDPNKKLTLFLANNNVGKTTFIQSFLWCLYGEAKLDNMHLLANLIEFQRLKTNQRMKVSVQLEIQKGETLYTIIRSSEISKNYKNEQVHIPIEEPLEVFEKGTDGATRTLKGDSINKLFPKELSHYFFFDGERMKELGSATEQSKKDVSEAVKNILNLDVTEKALQLVKIIVSDWEDKLTGNKEDESKLTEMRANKSKNEKGIESKEKELAQFKEEEANANERIKEIQEKLVENRLVSEKAKRRLDLERSIMQQSKIIEDYKRDQFSRTLETLIKYELGSNYESLQNDIEVGEVNKNVISGIDGRAIDEIIKRGICICGESIHKGSNHLEHLNELKRYIPPESVGVLIKRMLDQLNEYKVSSSDEISRLRDSFISYHAKLSLYSSFRYEKEELDKEIKKLSKSEIDLDELENSLQEQKEIMLNAHTKWTNAEKAILIIRKRIEDFDKEILELSRKNKINSQMLNRIELLKAALKQKRKDFGSYEDNVRMRLVRKVQSKLNSMLEMKYSVDIDKKYSFSIVDQNGNPTTGEGYKVLTSFAYIGGIIELANELKLESTEDNFPLTMDAPFAKLDEHNQKAVSELILGIARQVILFSVDSQWDGAVESVFKDHIGIMYDMKKSGLSDVNENGDTIIVRRPS